jgi:hypothetical protein
LASISIPASVTSIGEDAFLYATSLASITVDSINNNYSSDYGVLFNKDRTTLIQYPIGNSRPSYEIPARVTSIGYDAFYYATSLTSISIPASVTSIGSAAFFGSGLTQATINVDKVGVANFPSALGSGQTIGGKTDVNIIGYKVFSGTGILSDATRQLAGATIAIIEGYSSIGDSAFLSARSLTSITIPASVTSIGQSAFQSATSLTSISIPAGVTSIGTSAFQNATSLTSVSIPAGVTSIGINAFRGASSLTSVTFEADSSLNSIGTSAFNDTKLSSISIPASVTSIGSYAFYNVSSLTSISIPEGVTSIEYGAFSGASGLTSIIIPTGSQLTSIGSYVFSRATSLTSISIPANTSIGSSAFYGTKDLTVYITDLDAFNIKNSTSFIYDEQVNFYSYMVNATIINSPFSSSSRYIQFPLGVTYNNGDTIQFDTDGSNFDTELGLFNEAGNILVQNDDIGAGTDSYSTTSSITHRFNSRGKYYILVGGYQVAFLNNFGITFGTTHSKGNGILNFGKTGQPPSSKNFTIDNTNKGFVYSFDIV